MPNNEQLRNTTKNALQQKNDLARILIAVLKKHGGKMGVPLALINSVKQGDQIKMEITPEKDLILQVDEQTVAATNGAHP